MNPRWTTTHAQGGHMHLRIAALVTLIAAAPTAAIAQSFTFCLADGPRRNFEIVYYDADFLFASRHFGDARDAAGNTRPGFFVHSKAHDRWIEIRSVSTKDGRFGKSWSQAPGDSIRMLMVSVSWNFTHLAEQPFAELPLMTSGSIVLPDSIAYEPSTGRYMLDLMPSWRDVPAARTVMYIHRPDLVAAFAGLAKAPRCAGE